MRQRLEDRDGAGTAGRRFGTGQDGGRRTVAEERRCDEVRRRQVGALHAEAGQLDGDDQRMRVREADQEVVRPRERRGAGRASKFRDR